MIDAEGYKII